MAKGKQKLLADLLLFNQQRVSKLQPLPKYMIECCRCERDGLMAFWEARTAGWEHLTYVDPDGRVFGICPICWAKGVR